MDCIEYRICNILEYDYPESGVFLFNIEHPTFTAGVNQQWSDSGYWPVDNYFYPGERMTNYVTC